ncbi:hypothetical protein K7X08_030235 [Anisodus acutangulus]|uniref:Uncharacterized protein n=1 Tax=Anisodus acutangulus TaxID=402998 RepID=A0A9Q1LQX5_9SOLA|nr:hypothetical protein K7X08_030235 [Anisodus acutangulus]
MLLKAQQCQPNFSSSPTRHQLPYTLCYAYFFGLRKFCKDGSCAHQDREEVVSTGNREKGPVRGISLKLQEEERERRMDFVPDESAIKTDLIEVDKETLDMLSALGMSDLPGVVKQAAEPQAVAALPTFGRGAGGFGRKY